MRAILLLVVAACSHPAPPTPPVAPEEPPASPPAARPVALDDTAFHALLDREDWSTLLDARGYVSLEQSSAGVEIETKCPPRDVDWAKFEALAFSADLLAETLEEIPPPEPHHMCQRLGRYTFDCSAPGLRQHFRFVARGGRFVLVGPALYDDLRPADAKRYEAALRTRRCR